MMYGGNVSEFVASALPAARRRDAARAFPPQPVLDEEPLDVQPGAQPDLWAEHGWSLSGVQLGQVAAVVLAFFVAVRMLAP